MDLFGASVQEVLTSEAQKSMKYRRTRDDGAPRTKICLYLPRLPSL